MKPKIDSHKPSIPTALWIFAIAVLGIPVGLLLAPANQRLQYSILGFVTFLFISFMFLYTPNISLIASVVGWILGGAVLGLVVGVLDLRPLYLVITQYTPLYVKGAILLAIAANLTRFWRSRASTISQSRNT